MFPSKFIPPNLHIPDEQSRNIVNKKVPLHRELPLKKRIHMESVSPRESPEELNRTSPIIYSSGSSSYSSAEDSDSDPELIEEEVVMNETDKDNTTEPAANSRYQRPTADDAFQRQNLERSSTPEPSMESPVSLSRYSRDSSMTYSSESSNLSSTEDSDSAKTVSTKFNPPKPLDDVQNLVLRTSQIKKNLPSKKRKTSSDSPQNNISKQTVKKKSTATLQIKSVSTDFLKKSFTSADSSSEISTALPESNVGICSIQNSITVIPEQSESLLKVVNSTIDTDFDDSSREVTFSADFVENRPEIPTLCENKSIPPVSPVKKSSPRSSPAKESNPQTSPTKKSSLRSSPANKSSVLKPVRSLTDTEYEEIFSSVINDCVLIEDNEVMNVTGNTIKPSLNKYPSLSANDAFQEQNVEEPSSTGELSLLLPVNQSRSLSVSSSSRSSSFSSSEDDDWTKVISKKFNPPKSQNKFLDDVKKVMLKKSQIEKNLLSKKRKTSSDSPQNNISKQTVKKKSTAILQIKKVLKNLSKKAFISAISSSGMSTALPESNMGISSTKNSTTVILEQSGSLLKAVSSTKGIDSDDSSREVTSSADFVENEHDFPALRESKPSCPVSPVKKSSPQPSPAKESSPQTSPAKKSSPQSSPANKSSVLKPVRSLTATEYEEIFSSVINAHMSSSCEDVGAETQGDKQSMDLMNMSEDTYVSLSRESDKENKTPKKKSKLNSSAAKCSQTNAVMCSPWGHHYAKQSQDNLYNEFDGGSESEEEEKGMEEDSQVNNFSQATGVSVNSTSKKEHLKSVNSTPQASRRTSAERSPWGHHYSKMRSDSQNSEKNKSLGAIKKVTETNRCHKKTKCKESQRFHQESEDMFDNSSSSDSEAMSADSNSEANTTRPVDSSRKVSVRLSQTSHMPLSEDTIVTQRERLEWLQKQRNVGVWVQCMKSDCGAYRYLAHIQDPLEVPEKWHCQHHPDVQYQTCRKNLSKIEPQEDEFVIEGDYNAGSVVWAKVEGFPWWPAMVDDDPDTELYFWLQDGSHRPNYYNVVFFDSKPVTRAWIPISYLHKYSGYENCSKFLMSVKDKKDFRERILEAKRQATDALTMPLLERLLKYSFIARYNGPINDPLTLEEEEKMKLKKNNKKKTKKRHSEE